MKAYKVYDNLYRLYQKSMRPLKILFFVSLALFVLSFATFFLNNFPFGLTMIMMLMIFGTILSVILYPILCIRTKKNLKSFSPQQLKLINNEISECAIYDGILVTSQAVICTRSGGMQLLPMSTMLWIYITVTVHKLQGLIPLFKETQLVFAGTDRKVRACRIKNNGRTYRYIQAELLRYRQDIVFGFERGMNEIYKKDLNRMIAFGQECAEKRRRQMEEGRQQ